MAIRPIAESGRQPARVRLDGATLTPKQVALIAREGAVVELDAEAQERNDRARAAIDALLARGDPLYGVTTGVGALRAYRIPKGQRERYSLGLLRSHACGAGQPLPAQLVRAAMATRANQIGAGGAGYLPGAAADAGRGAERRTVAVHPRARLARHRRSDQPRRHRTGVARRRAGVARRRARRRRCGAGRRRPDAGPPGAARRAGVHQLQRGHDRARRAARGRRAPTARRLAVGGRVVVRGGRRRSGGAGLANPLLAPSPRTGGRGGADARATGRCAGAHPRHRPARDPGPLPVPRPAAGRRHRPRRAQRARGDRRARAQLRRRERADHPR